MIVRAEDIKNEDEDVLNPEEETVKVERKGEELDERSILPSFLKD